MPCLVHSSKSFPKLVSLIKVIRLSGFTRGEGLFYQGTQSQGKNKQKLHLIPGKGREVYAKGVRKRRDRGTQEVYTLY